jgi:hypothetical protein
MIPSSTADKVIHFDSRCYSGQFSDDGNFFFCCSQDFKVRMYDTSNPFEWKYYKTVDYPFGQWTITDASLSPDNKYLAYSSIRHEVCLAPTDPGDQSDPMILDFSVSRRRGRRVEYYMNSDFGASVVSPDGIFILLTDTRFGLFDSPGMAGRLSPAPLIVQSLSTTLRHGRLFFTSIITTTMSMQSVLAILLLHILSIPALTTPPFGFGIDAQWQMVARLVCSLATRRV